METLLLVAIVSLVWIAILSSGTARECASSPSLSKCVNENGNRERKEFVHVPPAYSDLATAVIISPLVTLMNEQVLIACCVLILIYIFVKLN